MQTTALCLTAWAVAVSVCDILQRRVPNWLVGLGAAFACVSLFVVRDPSAATPAEGLLGFLLAFVVFLPLYVFGAMGAADVKVFAVIGLWLGAGMLVPIWLWASAAAGIHAFYALARTRLPPLTVLGFTLALGTESGRQIRGAPYAAFLAIAALCVIASRHPSWAPGF
jgi:prepilin peptidase CpaA